MVEWEGRKCWRKGKEREDMLQRGEGGKRGNGWREGREGKKGKVGERGRREGDRGKCRREDPGERETGRDGKRGARRESGRINTGVGW